MWLLSKNAGFCCLFGAQVSAAYALTEGDASGPAQTLLAADTESDSDPDSGIATLPDLTEEHPVTLQPDEEPAPSDDASSGTQVVYYADPSDPDEPGDADTDVEIDPDGVDFGRYITKSEAQWRKNKNDSWHSWDELAGGALGYGDGLKFRLEYTLPTGSLWKNGTDQPDTIIFYQLPETLKNFTGSDKVYADHVAVGEYEIRDGVVTIHFTDMDYIGKSKESDIKGTIELSGTVSQLKADDDGKVELDFNKDVRFEMTVKPKPVDLSIVKNGIQKDVANNKITYQVTVSTEEGTQGTPVLLHDALQLNLGKALVGAKYDENSLKVSLDVEKNGNDKIYENTAPEGETANGWSVKTAADGKSFTAKGTGEWPANRQERITYSSTWDRDTSTVKGYAFTNAATFENYTVTGTNYYHEGTVVQKLDVSTGETETGGTTNHEYHELKNGKLVWNVVITMSDKMKKAASFTITENLPEGVKLEGLTFKQGDFFTGDVKFQSNEEETSWTASANGAPVTAEVAEDGKIELTVPQAVYNNPDLRNKTITLEVTVTPVNVAEWEHDTTHRFRNSVTVTSSTLPESGYTTFQEQDIFYNQNYNAIAKTGKKLDNALNQVQYQIVVNPDGVTFLDGKGRLKLVDTLTNHAVLSGTSSQGTSSGSDYEMKVQNSSASVKLSGVSLYKVDSSNYGKRLQGATFRLEKWVWNNAEKTGSWVTVLDRVTSDENGLLKTVGSDNRNLLQTGVAYRMVELEAPHGYELRMEPFDFYIDTKPANTPKDYAGQLCFTGQRVFIPNTRGYYDPQLTKNILESGSRSPGRQHGGGPDARQPQK